MWPSFVLPTKYFWLSAYQAHRRIPFPHPLWIRSSLEICLGQWNVTGIDLCFWPPEPVHKNFGQHGSPETKLLSSPVPEQAWHPQATVRGWEDEWETSTVSHWGLGVVCYCKSTLENRAGKRVHSYSLDQSLILSICWSITKKICNTFKLDWVSVSLFTKILCTGLRKAPLLIY